MIKSYRVGAYQPGTIHGRLIVKQVQWGEVIRHSRFVVQCSHCGAPREVSYHQLSRGLCRSCSGKRRRDTRPLDGYDPRGEREGRKGKRVRVTECCRERRCAVCAGLNRRVIFEFEEVAR